ncbi:MAG: (Fe-S)-binding protein [Chloroflexota bacterium]
MTFEVSYLLATKSKNRTGRLYSVIVGISYLTGIRVCLCLKDYATIKMMEKLITTHRFELVEDHHHPGSGRYGILITLPEDISAALPYLNTVLDDTYYDQENRVLIGTSNGRRYAFRPHEIQVGMVAEASTASQNASEAVDLVNQIWQKRYSLTPSSRERSLPTTYAIFKLLPRTSCEKQCGFSSCLAFAAELRNGKVQLEQCPLTSTPEYSDNKKQIITLFSTS